MMKSAALVGFLFVGNAFAEVNNQSQVASLLSGNFSSLEQSILDPEFLDISLKSCPIALTNSTRTGEFLYVEQSVARNIAKPYRQRLYRISAIDATTVESEILLINNPSNYIGFCDLPLAARVVDDSAIENRGCSVFLNAVSPGYFEGSTKSGGCASTFNGAVSVDSSVKLSNDLLAAWDIGRNADGQQVWGPEKGPYEFRRLKTP